MNTKARALTVYTLKITENEKWFPQSQKTFIEKLRDCVIDIQAMCWEANNINVTNEERFQRRILLQDMAADRCNRMHMLIETAKPLFHLESKRVRYWVEMTLELRNMIRRWRESDIGRHGKA